VSSTPPHGNDDRQVVDIDIPQWVYKLLAEHGIHEIN